jgi:hypothetical protein
MCIRGGSRQVPPWAGAFHVKRLVAGAAVSRETEGRHHREAVPRPGHRRAGPEPEPSSSPPDAPSIDEHPTRNGQATRQAQRTPGERPGCVPERPGIHTGGIWGRHCGGARATKTLAKCWRRRRAVRVLTRRYPARPGSIPPTASSPPGPGRASGRRRTPTATRRRGTPGPPDPGPRPGTPFHVKRAGPPGRTSWPDGQRRQRFVTGRLSLRTRVVVGREVTRRLPCGARPATETDLDRGRAVQRETTSRLRAPRPNAGAHHGGVARADTLPAPPPSPHRRPSSHRGPRATAGCRPAAPSS